MRVWWLTAATALVDQGTKALVASRLAEGESFPLWPPWLYLTHVRNSGAAFGLFQSQSTLLAIITIGVLLVALLYRAELGRQPPLIRAGVGFGLGGALGNLVDRLVRGAVVDFIDVRIWPVFNVADVAIVLAAALVIAGSLKDAEQRESPTSGGG